MAFVLVFQSLPEYPYNSQATKHDAIPKRHPVVEEPMLTLTLTRYDQAPPSGKRRGAHGEARGRCGMGDCGMLNSPGRRGEVSVGSESWRLANSVLSLPRLNPGPSIRPA